MVDWLRCCFDGCVSRASAFCVYAVRVCVCFVFLQVLQSAFDRLHIDKHIDVQRLTRGKYMDNLEFMQVRYCMKAIHLLFAPPVLSWSLCLWSFFSP